MSLSASRQIIKIMKDINYLNNINNINKIFNKSDEQVQIDFIKFLIPKIENITEYPNILISNVNTFRVLLEWSINFNDYNLCNFLLTHKDTNIIITISEYVSYEEKTKNKQIAVLLNEYKIKEAYNMELNYNDSSSDDLSDDESSDYDSLDDSSDNSSDNDSSDNDSSDESSDSSNFDIDDVD